jgi:hypothetical protein
MIEMADGIGAHLGMGRACCGRPREHHRRDGIVLGEGEEDRRRDLAGVTARRVAGDSSRDSGGGEVISARTRP